MDGSHRLEQRRPGHRGGVRLLLGGVDRLQLASRRVLQQLEQGGGVTRLVIFRTRLFNLGFTAGNFRHVLETFKQATLLLALGSQ